MENIGRNNKEFWQTFSHNSSPLNKSIVLAHEELISQMSDPKLITKASHILKQIDNEEKKCSFQQSHKNLSLLMNPKLKLTRSENRQKIMNGSFLKDGSSKKINSHRLHSKRNTTKKQQNTDLNSSRFFNRITNKKKTFLPLTPVLSKNLVSLTVPFKLMLNRIISDGNSELTTLFVQQLLKKYENYEDQLTKDILEISKIGLHLRRSIEVKEKFCELRSYQVMEVNGTVARLFFHIVHLISSKKYKYSNVLKIYYEIQYCARCLEFNRVTLKVCFEIGNHLKQAHKEEEAKIYFDKALRMAVFLNDRYFEEKALDSIGLSSYSESKTSFAIYFHSNYDKLSPLQRNHIRQKYSNKEEIAKLCNLRNSERKKQHHHQIASDCLKSYLLEGPEHIEEYELFNRNQFKEKVKIYIKDKDMRKNINRIRSKLEKINKIGKVKKMQKIQLRQLRATYKFSDEIEKSNEILLTHRSLNRANPDNQHKDIEKQRKILLELLSFFTSDQYFDLTEIEDNLASKQNRGEYYDKNNEEF